MDLVPIRVACQKLCGSVTNETIAQFMQELESIPLILGNSTASFHAKLISITEAGLFTAMKVIMKNPIETSLQLRLLRFWDFLISTCGAVEELSLVFADQVINALILYPFDFSSTEVLQSYITVLKGISMRANELDVSMLFTRDMNDCPLYAHAVPFIVNKDSIVVSGARLVVLNLCLCHHPMLQSFISVKVIRAPFVHLIDHANTDELSFLSDLLNVAPLELREFLLEHIEKVLMTCDLIFLAKAAQFLDSSKAQFALVRAISKRITDFPATSALSLGLLLYALEHRLLLLDYAINYGIVERPPLPTFSEHRVVNESGRLVDNLCHLLIQRISVPLVAIQLRSLEKLFKTIPSVIYDANHLLIQELRSTPTAEIIEIFMGRPEPRQRCDLDFLINCEEKAAYPNLPRGRQTVLQLAEVQASIGRYTGTSFKWFQLEDIDDSKPPAAFTAVNGKVITLSASRVMIGETEFFELSKVYLASGSNDAKSVTIVIPPSTAKAKLTFEKPDERRFEFPAGIASNLRAEIARFQRDMIHRMLEALPQSPS
jgi:hypothetical protein